MMEIQFHPASGRRGVRTVSISRAALRAVAAGSAAFLLLAASLGVTVPAAAARFSRQGDEAWVEGEARSLRQQQARVDQTAAGLKQRGMDRADLLNRMALLYDVPPARWPRALAPERGLLAATGAESIARGLEICLRGLERGRAILEGAEGSDRDLPGRVPSRIPLAAQPFEPAAFFGPRVSPWTGQDEFFPGTDFAAAQGVPVVAPGAGTVVFSGTARRSSSGGFWRLGTMIVLSHGGSGATVFGHLSKIDVRRGQRVQRGQQLGAVGATGWAISPQLHYEYWRRTEGGLRPTDPLFAGLDHRLGRKPLSLDQMLATSAPGPLDPLPGIQVPADQAGAPLGSSPPASARRRPHRRRI